jgi:hypothetical protein
MSERTVLVAAITIAAAIACPAMAGEHWSCTMPHIEPVFYDFQVDGAKLVEKVATGVLPSATAPADVDLAIVQNDDHAITAIHPESIMPNEIANVVSIDKQRRIFKVILIYFGNGDIVSNGACTRQ